MNRHPIEAAIRKAAGLTGGKWLVCVSGGADSMALLHACVACGVELLVAHCNFGLRGQESLRDADFVRQACVRLQVECELREFNTEEYCRTHGVSIEMGCRELRYAWFRSLRCDRALRRIAVAHNADDDNETMLLNLLRGTGIAGLTGMKADSGEIIRPLLPFSRAEIEGYLNSIGAKWITDSSNLSSDYKRNFLRNEILPALRSRWPGLDKTLPATRRLLCQSRELAEEQIKGRLAGSSPSFLPASALKHEDSDGSVIRAWLEGKTVSSTQLREIVVARAGARWRLRQGMVSRLEDGLHFDRISSSLPEPELIIERMPMSGALLDLVRSNTDRNLLYCKPAPGLHLRPARSDDRMQLLGIKGSSRVFKILKEAGLTLPQRQQFLLLCDDRDRVVWLPGIKRSSLLPIGEADSELWKIRLSAK